MTKTKVLLFSPELRERTYPGRPPIYYLAPVLREAGHQVVTIDVDIAGRQKFIDVVRDFGPDVIGGSSLSIQINEAMELMELAKKELPSAITVLGGDHATMAGKHLYPVHAGYLDAVAVGEGLTTLPMIANVVERKQWEKAKGDIPGLLLWTGSRVKHNNPAGAESPDRHQPDFPYFPEYNFKIFDRKDGTQRKTFQFMTAFGCDDSCFFCESAVKRHEQRMSLGLAESILRRARGIGYEAVYFDDDTFTRDRAHALELSRMCSELGLVFGCHTRPDCEDEDLIRQFAANGCRYMFSGMESAVDEILRGANKTNDPQGYREAYVRSYRVKAEVGLPASAFMIHGMARRHKNAAGHMVFEPDTLDDSRESIRFALGLDPKYLSMNVLRFIPGVPYSTSKNFAFMRPAGIDYHGGYFDKKWLVANGKEDPRCFHPILRAFEGSGSPTPVYMTPRRCYDILAFAVEETNRKNTRVGTKNQTEIVVDDWFEKRFLAKRIVGGILQYQLAPFRDIDKSA